MGVDLLIVVDTGFPLLERAKLDSVATVSNQMLAILIRNNTKEQRRTLTESDIVIDPALGDFSSIAFNQHARAIEIGERAANEVLPRLQALSVPEPQFREFVARRDEVRQPLPRVDFLRVDDGSERYAGAIDALFGDQVGQTVDGDKLAKRVSELYGQGNLEIFDYRLVPGPEEDQFGIALGTRRNSWGPNYLRFGLQLQNDFEGNSSFNAALRGTLAEITRYGGEWVWDLQVGETPRVATEVYLPVGYRSRWFVAPHGEFLIRTLPIIDANDRILAEYRVRTTDFGFDFGRELGNWGEVRVGWGRSFGESTVRVGDPVLPTSDFDSRKFFGEFRVDTVDDVNFPRRGGTFSLGFQAEREGKGGLQGTSNADLLLYDQLYAKSWGLGTAILWGSAGMRLDDDDDIDIVRSYFSLGGFLNMSGIAPESLVGPNFAILRGIYYQQVGRGGSGILDLPVYVGVSLEAGNVWDNRRDISFDTARTNGSVFIGLDSLLGPVYLAMGFDDDGGSAYYLFLGRTF
jgi:NTE family protein